MAHASKSFVVFNGGEWSEQLHGRTDLAKADSAGRKVRNFVPAQTGRLSRRKGLEFVGAALGECLAGDPRFEIPTWAELDEDVTFTPVDVYGALGMEELRSSEVVGPIWQICNNVAYCWGPTQEGETMTNIGDRYRTRWVAKLEDGNVFYRRVGVGDEWQQVSGDLIAQPNVDMLGLGFCFDANARPCFASQIAGTVYVWRWQASTLQEYSFPGQGPRLFFDGTVQPDNTLWDVVCYFCWNGDLMAAFQRENFLTNHTLFTSEDYYLTRVKLVEYGSDDRRVYIAAIGNGPLYGMMRSAEYPAWPFYVTDIAASRIAPSGGAHVRTIPESAIINAGDAASSEIAPVGGIHRAVLITLATESDAASSAIAPLTAAHKLVLVTLATESDSASSTIEPQTGLHRFTLIQAGTYSDSAASTIAPKTGAHIHV